jgi:hypothetical protein
MGFIFNPKPRLRYKLNKEKALSCLDREKTRYGRQTV